jgi:non-specific serine/threonine protein kinase
MTQRRRAIYLKVKLLGGFEVRRNDHLIPVQTWTRSKTLALFKFLVAHRGEAFTHDQLLEQLFWSPSVPVEKALDNLYRRISEVRRVLEPNLKVGSRSQFILNAGAGRYCFDQDAPCWVDTEEFMRLVETAQRLEASRLWAEALEQNDRALALYQGDFLSEDRYEEWTLALRERWRERFIHAKLRTAECYARLGQYLRAIEQTRHVLELTPTNEPAYRQKMRYHAWAGEESAALDTFQDCVKNLQKELHVEPTVETQALHRQILQHELTPPPRVTPTNVPTAINRFIGREREIEEIRQRLSEARLLTLTGPGGTGKTRLAQQISSLFTAPFPDGVWWVSLALLTDPALVSQAVASVLGVREELGQTLSETIGRHLRPKQLLLVLDNCEHLIGACAQLAEELLHVCPQLKILATSREALRVSGEMTWPVPSLSTPDPTRLARGSIDLTALRQYEAISLFIDRARAGMPAFALSEKNASMVTQICRRLDGIPLAIELAAAKVKVLSVEQIAARLEDLFQLLTGPHRTTLPKDQTLQATMDWSYHLLTEKQRLLFRRLSVFAGGFRLEAAEAVCSDMSSELPESKPSQPANKLEKSDILSLLTQLIDKSLVELEDLGGERRYRMLEIIREYAQHRLIEQAESAASIIKARHRDWYLMLAEQGERELLGVRQAFWLRRLEDEYDNFRAALRWSLETENESVSGLHLAAALGPYWLAHGHVEEGSKLLEGALAKRPEAPISARAKGLLWAGTLARHLGDFNRVSMRCQESLALFTSLQEKWGMAFSLRNLGVVAQHQGDYARAIKLHQQSLELARELGDPWSIAWSLHNLGVVARRLDDFPRVEVLGGESVMLFRRLGDKWGVATSLTHLAEVAEHRNDPNHARQLYQESLKLFHELGDKRGIIQALNRLADEAEKRQNLERAALLAGASESLADTLGSSVPRRSQVPQMQEKSVFKAAQDRGRQMRLEEVIAYALES